MPNMNEENNDKLVPLTVRFTGPAIDTIRSIAKEHGFSAAEIIRFTMDNKLKDYLGSVQFMDYDQGEEVRLGIIDLEKAIANVGRELNRIGVNYNQEVRLRNIARKKAESENDSKAFNELAIEEMRIKSSNWAFDKQEVQDLFEKYEATAKMVAELISLIQG